MRFNPEKPGEVPTSVRSGALDVVKGVLVIGMVFFHTINYFAVGQRELLVYIRFVSGGFIFVTGYIVSAFHAAKWAERPFEVSGRLFYRGVKLIVLFTALNLAINMLAVRNHNTVDFSLDQFADNLFEIYVVGRGRIAAFEILLPIGYLLLISSLLFWLQRFGLRLTYVALLAVASTLLWQNWHLNNYTLLLVGGAGLLVGCLLPPDQLGSRRHLAWSLPAATAVAITFPWLRQNLLGYIVYVVSLFKVVADSSEVLPARWWARHVVVLYGEYVLLCYLAHIVILQLIFRLIWPHRDSSLHVVGLIVAVTCTVLILLVAATRIARQNSQIVDRIYRGIFA